MSGSANKIWITERPSLQRCPNLSSDDAKDCGEHPRVEEPFLHRCPRYLISNDAKDCGSRPRVKSTFKKYHAVAHFNIVTIANYTFRGFMTPDVAEEIHMGKLTSEDIRKAGKSCEITDGSGCTDACIVNQLLKKVMEKLGLEGDLFRKGFGVYDPSGKPVKLERKRKIIPYTKTHKVRMSEEPAKKSGFGVHDWSDKPIMLERKVERKRKIIPYPKTHKARMSEDPAEARRRTLRTMTMIKGSRT